jgi:4-amino-4-deoxy-L-arabinose transferase-like glycosyltransferase
MNRGSELGSKRSNSFISSRWAVIVILVVSILVRVAYFTEMIGSPCYVQHLWDQSDMHFFDLWAREIAGGDWLVNKPFHPFHGWHGFVAQTYFESYAEETREQGDDVSARQVDVEAMRRLWNEWYGGKRYHQEPLYPYLIAIVYRVAGARVGVALLGQVLIGVLNTLLIYLITKKLFGPHAAIVAGLLAALCSPLLYFEMVLLRATLISFFQLVLIWLVLRAERSGSSFSWWIAGLWLGLAVLLKSIFLLFVVGLAGWTAFRNRSSLKRALRYESALLIGVVVSLSPLIARNIFVGAPPLGLTSVTAVTFLTANAHDSYPRGFFITRETAPVLAKTRGALVPTVIETLRTHPPGGYLKLLWRKLDALLHWYEMPNNANFYYYRLHSRILRYLPVTFLILAPLVIVGIGVAIYERQDCMPLYLLVGVHVISMLLTCVLARFRAPLIWASMPFAAYAIVRIVEGLRRRETRQTIILCGSLVLISLWTMRGLPQDLTLIRTADYGSAYRVYYEPRILAATAEENWPEVVSIFEESLQHEPQFIRELSPSRLPRNESERTTTLFFAKIRSWYADALEHAGRYDEAHTVARRAEEMSRLSGIRN